MTKLVIFEIIFEYACVAYDANEWNLQMFIWNCDVVEFTFVCVHTIVQMNRVSFVLAIGDYGRRAIRN